MEQLTDPLFHLEAIVVNGDGGKVPFSLMIFPGGAEELGHYCRVRSPHIRKRDIKIFGGDDDDEALANAILFVESYLKYGNEYLVDANGLRIDLPPYAYEATEP